MKVVAVPLPYKGPLSKLQATELGIGTRRPKSRSMTHLGNRPSLLARVVSEARSQEARVQVYAPPKPSCVTLEQQLSLFGLRERERAKEALGSEGSFREGRAAGSIPCCCFLKDPGLLASQAPSTKLASENHVPYAEWEERKLTKELDTPLQSVTG